VIEKNFIDRIVEYVAPAHAATRYVARMGLKEMSHSGAVGNRGTANDWPVSTSYKGGASSDRRDFKTMRSRARRLFRENVIGRSLLLTETDNVVSDGFSLQMLTDSPAFNDEAEARFYEWLDRADITGRLCGSDLFRASWIETRKDGDGGFILIKRNGKPFLQYVSSDLIETPIGKYNNASLYDGIEIDASGRPLRFWVRDVDEFGKDTSTPIAARDFVYIAHPDDPNALRGTTAYGSVFRELDQLDGYKEAVIIAARMGAIFGLIEKRKNPAAATNGLPYLSNTQGETQKAITYENGMMKYIGPDDAVMQVQAQQPMQQTPDFIRAMMRVIGLAFDMPLEIAVKDLSQVNFSGARVGLIGFYRSCRVKQDRIKSICWNRIVRWWLSVEQQRQALGFEDAFVTPFPARSWEFALNGREWAYNSPTEEANAALLEISMGIKSPQMACEERGRDWREVQDQIQEARASNEARKIPSVLSSSTRDEAQPAAPVATESTAADPLAQFRSKADAYGIAVRAGVITPQTEDENVFRSEIGLPPMRTNAADAWQIDNGVRRPITLTPPPGTAAPAPVAIDPNATTEPQP